MHPRRSALALVVAAALALAPATPANAARDADVSTDPSGAQVVLVRDDTWVEVLPPGGGGDGSGGAGGGGCRRRWMLSPVPMYLRRSPGRGDYTYAPMPPAPSPQHRPYHVFCDDRYITSVWLLPSVFTGGPTLDPRSIAQRLVRDLPYPAATVGISPSTRGLTGLEAWFWVTGYSGEPLRDAVAELGMLVEVEARPAVVAWDFGDGTPPVSGSLGQAAPARSDVVHRYERRSRGEGLTVRAAVRLDVRWRLDGGPWQPLDPVLRTAARAYPVVESRAALVPAGG